MQKIISKVLIKSVSFGITQLIVVYLLYEEVFYISKYYVKRNFIIYGKKNRLGKPLFTINMAAEILEITHSVLCKSTNAKGLIQPF